MDKVKTVIDVPELHTSWHHAKNLVKDLHPDRLTLGSSKKAWWLGDCGHEWEAIISNRSRGSKCPYCCNQKILKGYNDLATTNPKLANQWHPTKNGKLTPDGITSGVSRKVWWSGECNHEWEAAIGSRNKGIGCPYCARTIPTVGENDLKTVKPELLKEWHPTKNKGLKPESFQKGSGKTIWWKCAKHHEWATSIRTRAVRGAGCPECSKGKTSQQEVKIKFYLEQYFKDTEVVISSTKVANRQIDVIVTYLDKQIHIEYDGGQWHKNVEKDYERDSFLLENVPNLIKIIRIRDQKCPKYLDKNAQIEIIELRNKEINALFDAINKALTLIGKSFNLLVGEIKRTSKDELLIREFFITEKTKKSISITHPILAAQFHPSKNGALQPSEISRGERLKLWWICGKNHEWEANIRNRIRGSNCPYCSGNKVLKGFNDLTTTHSNLASEWNYQLNLLTPEEVSAGSDKKVWWICKNQHTWPSKVSSRKQSYNKCPKCK